MFTDLSRVVIEESRGLGKRLERQDEVAKLVTKAEHCFDTQ